MQHKNLFIPLNQDTEDAHQLLHVLVRRGVEVHEPMRIGAPHRQVAVHHLGRLLDVELFDPEKPEQEVVRVDGGFVQPDGTLVTATASEVGLLEDPSPDLFQACLAKLNFFLAFLVREPNVMKCT